MRVLSISTLFPSPERPAFGKFVANQMRAVAKVGEVELVMVNPIGVPPWPLSRAASQARLLKTPERSDSTGIAAWHPRFRSIPKIGVDTNPARIAAALLPLVQPLHADKPFDLVDAQFFFPDGPAAALVAEALQLPFSIKARGSDIHYWGQRPNARAQMLRAANGAAGLLAVSQALADDMVELGMPTDKISVHYTGLDRAQFHPIERKEARALISANPELAICARGPLIITPGALIPVKGQRLAVAALTHLTEVNLVLAGTGADEIALRRFAQDLGVSKRVKFLGQVSHDVLPQLFSAADAVVLPSEREGLANVWVEALACGTPLVIPDIGGAREVLRDPSAGRLALRDPQAIAAAVQEILACPLSQDTVAANAKRFDWDVNASELATFWQRIAKR